MSKKATLRDVAERAGVGLATVDRVLNERGETSAATTAKVIEAAKAVGLRRVLPEPHRAIRRLRFIVPPPNSPFRQRLNDSLRALRQRGGSSVLVSLSHADPMDAQAIAAELAKNTDDAVAFCRWGQGDAVMQAAVSGLRAKRQAAYSLLNAPEGLSCDGFFGMDNQAAGRTVAALAKGRLQEYRDVMVLSPMRDTPLQDGTDPNARQHGFAEAMARYLPGSRIVAVDGTRNDPERVFALASQAFAANPNIGMVYNLGSGNPGLRAVLMAQRERRPVFAVAHELSETTEQMLRERLLDFVINQQVEATLARAVEVMLAGSNGAPQIANGLHYIPFAVHCIENLPSRL